MDKNISGYWIASVRLNYPHSPQDSCWGAPAVWLVGDYQDDRVGYRIYFEGCASYQTAHVFQDGDDPDECNFINLIERLGDDDDDLDFNNVIGDWRHRADCCDVPLEWSLEPVGNHTLLIDRWGRVLLVDEGSHDWYVRRCWRAESTAIEPERTYEVEKALHLLTVRYDGFVVSNDIEPTDAQIATLEKIAKLSSERFEERILTYLWASGRPVDWDNLLPDGGG